MFNYLKKYSYWTVFLGVFPSSLLFSQEKASLETRWTYKETQERIFMRTLDVRATNHRRDLFWPYEGSVSQSHDFGADLQLNDATSREYKINGERFRLTYGYQFSEEFLVDVKAGVHHYKGEPRDVALRAEVEHSNPVGEVRLLHKNAKGNHILSFEYDNLYSLLQLPAGVSQNLRYLNVGYRGSYKVSATHEITGGVLERFYSDDNRRMDLNISSMHKFSSHELFPWLGFGASYLDSKKNVVGYWTPRSQTSYGPRISWSYWHSNLFSMGIFSDINYYYDSSSKDSGIGHYTAMMFWLGDRNKLHGILELVRMDSAQNNSSEWFENDISLTVHYPF